MLRHVAVFTWNEHATPAVLDEIVAALRALPGEIPELRAYHVGSDAGLDNANAAFAVVADFDDEPGWRAYMENPVHRAVRDRMRPLVATRAAVQYEWS
ncbi:MAG TPA: Dabb family protein [Acidimicrobiia bacterium]|nr:Dabb family protein [Acidimicrobiia bacterium]